MEYQYTDEDYKSLEDALVQSELICNGRPDIYQYYQNQLNKSIARFILKPYFEKEKQDK